MVTRDEIENLLKKLNSMDETVLKKLADSYFNGSIFDFKNDPSCPLTEYELLIYVNNICKPFEAMMDSVFNQLNSDWINSGLANSGSSNVEFDTLKKLPELPKLQRFAEDML